MNMFDIREMVSLYEAALEEEYNAGAELTEANEALDSITAQLLAEAQGAGLIDGKNADARKRQAAAIVDESVLIDASRAIVHKCETEAAGATITRKAQDALIGLTKAWLYSQSGR